MFSLFAQQLTFLIPPGCELRQLFTFEKELCVDFLVLTESPCHDYKGPDTFIKPIYQAILKKCFTCAKTVVQDSSLTILMKITFYCNSFRDLEFLLKDRKKLSNSKKSGESH